MKDSNEIYDEIMKRVRILDTLMKIEEMRRIEEISIKIDTNS